MASHSQTEVVMQLTQKQEDAAIKRARIVSTDRRGFNKALLIEHLKLIDQHVENFKVREQAA